MASSSQPTIFGQHTKKRTVPVVKPWVEKYRPKDISQVVSQDQVTASLKTAIENGNLPHLLFYGPPGTGKTSTILALAREMFGIKCMRERVLELNASDERGIDVVRTKIKNFAQTTVSENTKLPPFKIIILDEADSMTKEAQAALRRTMELYTKMTRFCLICNYVSKIIEPLASRCAKFRFKPLSKEIVVTHIKKICEAENITAGSDMSDSLVKISGGDMRKCITLLQSCARWKGGQAISGADVAVVAGTIPTNVIDDAMVAFRSGNYEKVQNYVNEIILEGYSAVGVLEQLHERIINADENDISDVKKARIFYKMSEVDWALSEGADEELQLASLGSSILTALAA